MSEEHAPPFAGSVCAHSQKERVVASLGLRYMQPTTYCAPAQAAGPCKEGRVDETSAVAPTNAIVPVPDTSSGLQRVSARPRGGATLQYSNTTHSTDWLIMDVVTEERYTLCRGYLTVMSQSSDIRHCDDQITLRQSHSSDSHCIDTDRDIRRCSTVNIPTRTAY